MEHYRSVVSLAILTEQTHDFFDAPDVIGDSGFHGWRYAQRLMDAAEIQTDPLPAAGALQIELTTPSLSVDWLPMQEVGAARYF